MGSHAYASPSPFFVSSFNTSNSKLPLKTNITSFPSFNPPNNCHLNLPSLKTNATLDEKDQVALSPLLVQEQQQSDSKQLKGGRYFPLAAVQRFDAADIEVRLHC
ncbi:hypothetical protein Patl1_19288 [Pistacia atlantica]|uniref:Uncharacterized protein n=1 Tax=Pistacia atlantica TaxID=434234 RepID=A0ACC1C2A6_9ROSI|nr:hypothetical protein Patl1_19288 [Pistacia atlantica]